MIKDHQVLRVPTFDGGTIEFEVNFNDSEDVKDCQVIRVRNEKNELLCVLKRDDLMAAMLLIGTANDQKKLLPMKLTKIRKVERMLTFDWKATRDYKKGDQITIKAPWIDTIPETEEILAANVKNNPLKFLTK